MSPQQRTTANTLAADGTQAGGRFAEAIPSSPDIAELVPNASTDFGADGVHFLTGTNHDFHGFDVNGIHRTGDRFNVAGYDIDGFDEFGYNKRGFNAAGNHYDTGTSRDMDGRDSRGDLETKYDSAGIDARGFDVRGVHCVTLTGYDVSGFDVDGWGADGIHANGYDRTGHFPHEREIQHVKAAGTRLPPQTDEYVSSLNNTGIHVFTNETASFVVNRFGSFTKHLTQEEADEVAASRIGPWN